MKLVLRQKIWLAIVIAGNALLWLIPSDVMEQIARDRHTMLGCYSRTQCGWLVGVAMIPLLSFCGGSENEPEASRTCPSVPPAYGTVPRTLRADARGSRNVSNSEQCDLLMLGDSFAEGSSVSDEHVWPVHLAAKTDLTVYNLGMSDYHHPMMVEALAGVLQRTGRDEPADTKKSLSQGPSPLPSPLKGEGVPGTDSLEIRTTNE